MRAARESASMVRAPPQPLSLAADLHKRAGLRRRGRRRLIRKAHRKRVGRDLRATVPGRGSFLAATRSLSHARAHTQPPPPPTVSCKMVDVKPVALVNQLRRPLSLQGFLAPFSFSGIFCLANWYTGRAGAASLPCGRQLSLQTGDDVVALGTLARSTGGRRLELAERTSEVSWSLAR